MFRYLIRSGKYEKNSRASWDDSEPAVLRDLKLIINLFISTEGCIVKGEPVLLGAKCGK